MTLTRWACAAVAFCVPQPLVAQDCNSNGVPDQTEAGTWFGNTTLRASDGGFRDLFGAGLAISGNWAVVGAYYNDEYGVNAGAAYVFRHTEGSWNERVRLVPADPRPSQHFGRATAMAGDRMVVTARRDSELATECGAAYVFHYNGLEWVQQAKLYPANPRTFHEFGHAAGMSRDVIAIGSTNGSSVRVFRWAGDGWAPEQSLASVGGNFFGQAIAVSPERIVVGAYGGDLPELDGIGVAYVYSRQAGSWVTEQMLFASDAVQYDSFGWSVAIDHDVIVVGAVRDDDLGDASGSAYVFRYVNGAWVEEGKLVAPDGAPGDRFGSGVAIERNWIVVGARAHDSGGAMDNGRAYAFRYDGVTWNHVATFAPQATDSAGFGSSIRLSDGRLLANSVGDGVNGVDSGAVFTYHLGQDCNQNDQPDECDIASGIALDLNDNGLPDACEIACLSDLNSDGTVNLTDLTRLLGDFGNPGPEAPGDADGDGDTDLTDLAALIAAFGTQCG